MSLAKHTVRNSLYSLVAFVWPIALAFLVTPFVVHKLGTESYGILALVTSLVGFLTFSDFGISPSLVKYVSEYHAKKDYKSLGKAFSTALFFYLLLGLVAAACIVLFGAIFAHSLIKVAPHNVNVLKFAFYVAAGGFFLNMVLTAYSAIPGALQRFDITSRINVIASTVSSLLTVLVLLRGHGVVAVLAINIIMSFLAILVYSVINRRLLPEVSFLHPHMDRQFTRKIFSFGGYAAVSSLSDTILFQLDKIVIGSILGAISVSYYVVPGNLALKIHGLVAAIANITFPLGTQLFASSDSEKLHKLYFRSTRLIFLLLATGVTPMLVFAHTFLQHWLDPTFAQNSTLVLRLLLATYTVIALTVIPFYILYAAGKPKYATYFSVVNSALNVTLLFIFIPRFGIDGAAWAYLISVLPAFAFVAFVERKILQARTKGFYLSTLPKVGLLVLISLTLSFVTLKLISSLVTFLLAYAFVLVASAAIFYLLGLFENEDLLLIPFLGEKLAR